MIETDLPKPIHPPVVTYPDHHPGMQISHSGLSGRIMHHHRRRPSLDYMNWHIICFAQGQDFQLAAPYGCIPYGYTIVLEMLGTY
jgi:hypothetical protein